MRAGTPHLGLLWKGEENSTEGKTGIFALRRRPVRLPLPSGGRSGAELDAIAASWDPRPATPPPREHLRYLQLLPSPGPRRAAAPPPLPEDVTRLEKPQPRPAPPSKTRPRRSRPKKTTTRVASLISLVGRARPRAGSGPTLAIASAMLGRADASALTTNRVNRGAPYLPWSAETPGDETPPEPSYDPFADDRLPRPLWARRTVVVGALVAVAAAVAAAAAAGRLAWNEDDPGLRLVGQNAPTEAIEVTVRSAAPELHRTALSVDAEEGEDRGGPALARHSPLTKGRVEHVPIRTAEPIDRDELDDILAAGVVRATVASRRAPKPAAAPAPAPAPAPASPRRGVDPEEILAAALDTAAPEASGKRLGFESARPRTPEAQPTARRAKRRVKRRKPARFANGHRPLVPAWMR